MGWAKMIHMDPQAFQQEIASPQRKSFYLIAGEDPSAITMCLDAAKKIVNPAMYQLNYRKYGVEVFGKKFVAQLNQDLTSNPFGTPPRLVVIFLLENEKLTAPYLEILSRLKPRIIRNAVLIVAQQSDYDKRLKFFKDIVKNQMVVDCEAPSRSNLHNWVIARFKDKGLRIGVDAARLMIERGGTNLGILMSEIDKLAIYPGSNVIITTDHIRSLVCVGSSALFYELASPLAQGRLDKAIPIMLDLLDSSNPIALCGSLASHFDLLLNMKLYLESKSGYASDDELASVLFINKFRVKYFREEADLWSIETLKEAFSTIEGTIHSILTGKAPPELALETLAVVLASKTKGVY
jgi:DNA polymerase III delta subunit